MFASPAGGGKVEKGAHLAAAGAARAVRNLPVYENFSLFFRKVLDKVLRLR
jgi:hypothetical protein